MAKEKIGIIRHENKHFVSTKDKLDKVGCGFCLAKWTDYDTDAN